MSNNDFPAAKQILLLGAAPELKRPDGETHLQKAVEVGDLELVHMLIKAGDDAGTKHLGNSLIDIARIKVRAFYISLSLSLRFSPFDGIVLKCDHVNNDDVDDNDDDNDDDYDDDDDDDNDNDNDNDNDDNA